MVFKTYKRDNDIIKTKYQSSSSLITSKDIKEADKFDDKLSSEITEIEEQIKKRVFNDKGHKQNKLKAWYIIGKKINQFRKKNKISPDEEKYFWEVLYDKFSIVGSSKTTIRNKKTRNDFQNTKNKSFSFLLQ